MYEVFYGSTSFRFLRFKINSLYVYKQIETMSNTTNCTLLNIFHILFFIVRFQFQPQVTFSSFSVEYSNCFIPFFSNTSFRYLLQNSFPLSVHKYSGFLPSFVFQWDNPTIFTEHINNQPEYLEEDVPENTFPCSFEWINPHFHR